MNKKISAVLISALMVLTTFSALVPTASAAEVVTSPYEFIGVADILDSNKTTQPIFNLTATSALNPSIMYYDIDDQEGNESLVIEPIEKNLEILKDNLTYSSTIWTDDGKDYVSYLGNKYFVVDAGSTEWILSQVLLEEDEDDDHLLRVGETLTLAEGFSVTALEIDVEGQKAWLSVSQDGEELKNLVVKEQDLSANVLGEFNFTEDLGASEDTTVVSFIVETVFAGMNTNLLKIHSVELISMATDTLESGDDTIRDYDISFVTDEKIIITNDEDISLDEDDIVDILGGMYGIRVGEAKENDNNNGESYTVGIVKVVTIEGDVVATATATAAPDETATVNGTSVVDEPGEGNATATATEVPTEEPTPEPEPGFEAIFAVAGLLAVAYLVLRQRD